MRCFAGLVIGRSRADSAAGVAGELSFHLPVLTHIRPLWQVTAKHAYTLDLTKSEWARLTTLSKHNVETYQANELTRNSVSHQETFVQSQSQLAEPL